jgi:hypothetical protein
VLHYDHGSSISQKGALTAWDDTSEEAFDALLLINVLSSLPGGVAEFFLASLGLIFQDLEGPNKPVTNHCRCARAKKLPYFVIKDSGMTPHCVQNAKEGNKKT